MTKLNGASVIRGGVLFLFFVLLFGCIGEAPVLPSETITENISKPEIVVINYTDLAYANVSEKNKLDIYLPEGKGPYPLIIYVHGGGWISGSRKKSKTTNGTA